ncbi:MAG: DegT/DnrJ/EryC1/StrS family aminotransferase [Lachnospiraceae bacterium]|nr:DegT/DnrJ/EryC1/StrS family aminotransferase [Lachnospiraceae bacterium]
MKRFENKIWLATPTMHGDEQNYVQEAFDTNWVSTVGANLNALEEGICEKVGCKYAVALSAGTAALHLAVRLAGIQPGDSGLQCGRKTNLETDAYAANLSDE